MPVRGVHTLGIPNQVTVTLVEGVQDAGKPLPMAVENGVGAMGWKVCVPRGLLPPSD